MNSSKKSNNNNKLQNKNKSQIKLNKPKRININMMLEYLKTLKIKDLQMLNLNSGATLVKL